MDRPGHVIPRETLRERLTSRKLWITIATIITLCVNKQYVQAAGMAAVYVGAQGLLDAKNVNTARQVEAQAHGLATQLLDELSQLNVNEADDVLPTMQSKRPLRAKGR